MHSCTCSIKNGPRYSRYHIKAKLFKASFIDFFDTESNGIILLAAAVYTQEESYPTEILFQRTTRQSTSVDVEDGWLGDQGAEIYRLDINDWQK